MNFHLLQEDALGWRAKATEAIGIIAAAIGVKPFRPHIQGIMQAAFQVWCSAGHDSTACRVGSIIGKMACMRLDPERVQCIALA